MRWLDDWSDWLGNKPWYIQILIGVVTIPLMLLLLMTAYVMLRAGWDFIWGIIGAVIK
jgi:hypothetical protein